MNDLHQRLKKTIYYLSKNISKRPKTSVLLNLNISPDDL